MHVNRALRAVANAQWGYFTARQAVAAGYGPELHCYHTRCKNWTKVARALYRLPGYTDSTEAEFVRWSLWAAGQCPERRVVISHASALHYYGLSPDKPQQVELCASEIRSNSRDAGCRLHLERLPESDYSVREGFCITTPSRTLLDMKPDLVLNCRWTGTVRMAREAMLLDESAAASLIGREAMLSVKEQPPGFGVRSTLESHAGATGGSVMMHPGRQNRQAGREWRMPNRSFTLIEMLVVIAIIGILASLLMPALQRAVESGRATTCRNNARQISICMASYVDDWGGWLPGISVPHVWLVSDKTWPTWPQPYFTSPKEMLSTVTCPSYRRMWYGCGNYGLSYHWFAYPQWGKPFKKLANCRRASQTCFMADIECETANVLDPAQIMTGNTMNNIAFRHNLETVILWGDLHVSGYTSPPPAAATSTFWSGN